MADTPRNAPATSDVLQELRALEGRVVERIQELTPYVAELEELRAQADRMGIDLTRAKPARRSRATATAAAGSKGRLAKRKPATGTRRRRKRSGESRAEQVARLVAEQPGITVPALGERMGIDSTGLYRVVRDLEGEGRLRKVGRELQPVNGGGIDEASAGASTADQAVATA